MKIIICDPCKKLDNKITETDRRLGIKYGGRRVAAMTMHVCEAHEPEVRKLSMPDYIRYVYRLDGIEVKGDDQEVLKLID